MILINSSSRDTVKIFQPFYPIHPPVGIGYLLTAAGREGIKARHIDQQVENDVLGLVARYVREMDKPYIFGFSVLTASFKNAVCLSRELKRLYPGSFIVFGGVHPTLVPEEVLSYDHIDAVVRDEGEKTLIELYKCVKNGRDPGGIDGLSYRRDGRTVHNKERHVERSLDAYPAFPYHMFDHESYDMGFVMSSRGCPYKCIFCSCRSMAGSQIYRYRAAEALAEELEMLHHTYNRKSVIFADDNFLMNKKRLYTLIELIKRKGLHKKMEFSFQARGDNVEYALCKDLYSAGFRLVLFGLETASERIMKTIKKGETVAQCVEAVRIVKDIGFSVGATFVFALPGETHEDRMNCVRLTRELGVDIVRYNNAIPYPGTELYEIARREKRLNIQGMYENFIAVSGIAESPFKKIPFAYVPTGNSEDDIRRDILISYFATYFNIRRTLRALSRPARVARWFEFGKNLSDAWKKVPALFALGALLVCKAGQCIYYALIKRETALPFRHLLRILSQGSPSG